ncbi:MAG: hypothetical protein AAGJ38_02055, partial [Planctomycetota bacterium]
ETPSESEGNQKLCSRNDSEMWSNPMLKIFIKTVRRASRLPAFASVALLFLAPVMAESPWRDVDRLAISMDGNGGSKRTNSKHTVADPDDIGASAVSLAIIAKLGLQDQLVHFDFNNWMDVGTVPADKDRMTESVIPGCERWGFDSQSFFDLTLEPERGIENLTKEINRSSPDSRLYIIAAGPVESIYRAVAASDPEKLQYVALVSHSVYNETQRIQDHHRTIGDFDVFRSQHGLGYLKIRDQNASEHEHYLWHSGKNFEVWAFLRDSQHSDFRWLFERIKAHTYGKSDVSDAGMVYYLLTGDDEGSPSKLKSFLGDGIVPDPARSRTADSVKTIKMTAKDHFLDRDIAGFAPSYYDAARDAIAVNAAKYPNAFAASQATFVGASGTYDVTLTALTEIDGESTYRLAVDGKLIGESKNLPSESDYAPQKHLFRKVRLNNGAEVRVSSNSVSNGKVPEGDAFAFARGRWREISFRPKQFDETSATDTTIDNLIVIQAEHMERTSGWEIRMGDAASSNRYVVYTGSNSFKDVTPHRLQTTFTVHQPGRYTVKWLMRQPEEVPGDQANDAWIHFPDALQHGRHAVIKGFHKFVGRSKQEFGFNGQLDLHGDQPWMMVTFPEAGEYKLEFAGRSQGFELDAIVLYRDMSFDQAKERISLK